MRNAVNRWEMERLSPIGLLVFLPADDTFGVRLDILEKDYYVSLLLRELAEKQKELPAYFKGGTALYKAQKSIRRFSQDMI